MRNVISWTGSARSLNHGDFSGVPAMLVANGVTVGADGTIADIVAGASVGFLGEMSAAPTAGEIASLLTWIQSGGLLLIQCDTGSPNPTGGAAANTVLSGIGSTMTISNPNRGAPVSNLGTNIFTASPYNCAGQPMETSACTTMNLGSSTAIADNKYISYEQIGSGYVVLTPDPFFHPALDGADDTFPNGQIMVNICYFVNLTIAVAGALPIYNPSLVSAIAAPQQGLPFPKFVMGGRGGASGTTYGLFKQSTTYGFNLWRSEVFHVGELFYVKAIRIPLNISVVTGMRILPILKFDNENSSSIGTEINVTNYPNGENYIVLTPDNFATNTQGLNNFYLELQFLGTVLAAVALPITIDVETIDINN